MFKFDIVGSLQTLYFWVINSKKQVKFKNKQI